jgi:hypothetical protein
MLARFRAFAIVLILSGVPIGATAQVASAGSERTDGSAAGAPGPTVLDARLAGALATLVRGSASARAALEGVERSGLTVLIGTPGQIAAAAGAGRHPARREHAALLGGGDGGEFAWVVFRTAVDGEDRGFVEEAWVVVEIDRIGAALGGASDSRGRARLDRDLLAVLAHEFVAHVGSVAETRRIEDLCDDPTPEQRRRSRDARSRGEPPPLNGEMASCALRVENRVRSELNRALALRGARAFPPRQSYGLDVMHFAHGRTRD